MFNNLNIDGGRTIFSVIITWTAMKKKIRHGRSLPDGSRDMAPQAWAPAESKKELKN